ncbi:Crp/Fnr family transcriptional regulator [uncultured Draconibacterium sp.]|uniref:Crp/Fnr family transcriptional regulator n=1 Tax=uncultured Draconibacterium sp. TaxID=1573823 RepID=UPI0029C7D83A|nr:Crp/Fnr family transcriptional regulator [uncultured Draconibacterium sp.]
MPLNKYKKCLGCSCMSAPFKELTNEELIQINRNRVEVNFKRGENIIKQGALAGHIVYIKSGLVKVYREHANDELILSVENRGKLLGLQALYSKNIYPYSVKAYTDTSVCLHDIKSIDNFIHKNAKFSASILHHLNDESLFSYNRMACLTLKQLHGRFADLLLCFSLRLFKRKKFTMPISKKDMAAITNMSQESLSRVIKEFVSERIIELKGKEITIIDFDRVRHLSQVG